jgi:hypothetical protein
MRTKSATTAQKISSLLEDDGQHWTDSAGRHLNEIAEAEGGKRTFRDGRGTDTYRWQFGDGSALLVAGDAWDFPCSPDSRCFCLPPDHNESCPLTHSLERGRVSRTAARRQAHSESHMFRHRPNWIVSTWSDEYRSNVLSRAMPYLDARQALADWRRSRTLELLGEGEASGRGSEPGAVTGRWSGSCGGNPRRAAPGRRVGSGSAVEQFAYLPSERRRRNRLLRERHREPSHAREVRLSVTGE